MKMTVVWLFVLLFIFDTSSQEMNIHLNLSVYAFQYVPTVAFHPRMACYLQWYKSRIHDQIKSC